jgi:pimeloyl-ACP methyl ester carboxylesterase
MVVVHSSIDNREEAEMRMARIITGLTQSMGVLVVHLPDYGPRRIRNGDFLADGRKFNAWDLNSDFLNPDLGELKENIAQAVLDIHAAMDWAQTLPSVDPDRVFLAGMSLGGMLQIIYAGMDPRPSIVAQAIFVGGGDLAGIMEHSFHKNPNEPTAILWRKKGLPETEIREQLLEVDPILWAHRIHNQDIYWINSEHDYLMLRDSNYGKVHSEFAADNDMSERWNDTTHAAEGENGIYVVTHIVLPIANFGASHSPAPPPYNCHSRHR